jgi:hypothetical protein
MLILTATVAAVNSSLGIDTCFNGVTRLFPITGEQWTSLS